MLRKKIEIVSEFSEEKVLQILKSSISTKFKIFPDTIMYGHIIKNEIKSVVNPPPGLVDCFRSRVKGVLETENNRTVLKIKLSPGWILIGLLIFWVLLIIPMMITFDFISFSESIKFLLFTIIWLLIPFLLAWIKLRWDCKRLNNWMIQKLKQTAKA
jgi:hypothetical protein